jgi:hypothetical protein
MSRDDLTSPVAAATTAQVKLCPYDEEAPHIWFRLIEAQFAAAGIKSQKLKYAKTLSPACPSKSFGTFWILSMFATTLPSHSIVGKTLCLGNLERANGSPTLNYSAFPWKCRASTRFSHGKAQTASPSRSFT